MQANHFNKLCFQIRDKYGTIRLSLKDILRRVLSLYCISNKDLSNMCNIKRKTLCLHVAYLYGMIVEYFSINYILIAINNTRLQISFRKKKHGCKLK